MKKICFMIISAAISIISFVLANIQYNASKSIYGVLFMGIGILALVIYAIIFSHYIFKKVNDKNDLKIGVISIASFFVVYTVYLTSFNIGINLDVNFYNTLLMLLYISFLNLVIVAVAIFHFWNIHRKHKKTIYFLVISITLILVFLLSGMLFKHLPVVIVEAVKLIYFTSIILVLVYVVALAIYKIVKPLEK